MVAALTWGKKGMESAQPAMKEIGEEGQRLKDWFLAAVDRDTDAFNDVIAARRLPKKTDKEKAAREAATERANQHATRVPLSVLEKSVQALGLALRVARDGNPASASDAGVGGACALAAAEGAALNVRINLPSLTDEKAAAGIAAEQQRLLAQACELSGKVRDAVEQHLAP